MGWPGDMQPLPSILSEPLQYYLLVNSIACVELFVSFKLSLWLELGYSYKYWKLLAHCTKDILQSWKAHDVCACKESFEEIVRMNKVTYHEELRAAIHVENVIEETRLEIFAQTFMWTKGVGDDMDLETDIF